jgi:hypothetical protein
MELENLPQPYPNLKTITNLRNLATQNPIKLLLALVGSWSKTDSFEYKNIELENNIF